MPPRGGNPFAAQNLFNPTAHLNSVHNLPQASHLQQHGNPTLHSHNIGAHPFGAGNPSANGMSIFGAGGLTGMQGQFNGGPVSGGSGVGGTGLGSQAAQLGFAHGAALQEQQAHNALNTPPAQRNAGGRIRDVWSHNLRQEMGYLRQLVDRYPYVSVDTEFPGVVARPIGNFSTKSDYHYQTVRCNADLLKTIQLGITLWSAEGEQPPAQNDALIRNFPGTICPCSFQFNFQFSLEEDMYAEEYITMLRKAGVDFERVQNNGINPQEFGSLLITSGLVLDENVHWISIHGGYDFAYLMKIMYCKPLPSHEEEFYRLIGIYFPNLWDVKYILRQIQRGESRTGLTAHGTQLLTHIGSKSGLQELADCLDCVRMGPAHNAGSDAWLTGMVFFAIKDKMFGGSLPEDLANKMWGLNSVGLPASEASKAAALAAAGGQQQQQQQQQNGAMQFNPNATPHTHRQDGPSTPTTNNTGLSSNTPGGPHAHQGLGPLQAGIPGGAFGNFQFQK